MQSFVQIDQKLGFFLVEGTEEIGVIIEIRCAFVGTRKSYPVLVLPTLLIANLYIACELLAIGSFDGNTQGQWPVGGSYRTAIAVGLLWKTLHDFNLHTRWIRQKQAIPFHRTHIRRW